VGHHDDELAEGLALGLLLGWGAGRRPARRPASPSGCSNACGCLVSAALLVVGAALAVHLWYVTLPVTAAIVTAVVLGRRRRDGRP